MILDTAQATSNHSWPSGIGLRLTCTRFGMVFLVYQRLIDSLMQINQDGQNEASMLVLKATISCRTGCNSSFILSVVNFRHEVSTSKRCLEIPNMPKSRAGRRNFEFTDHNWCAGRFGNKVMASLIPIYRQSSSIFVSASPCTRRALLVSIKIVDSKNAEGNIVLNKLMGVVHPGDWRMNSGLKWVYLFPVPSEN